MKKKREDIKRKGYLRRPFLNFNAKAEAEEDADQWYAEYLLGRRTVADEDDGTQVRTAQEEIDQAPLEMLLHLAQASFYKDRAKKEKAKGFNLAREQKRRDDTERWLWENIERERPIPQQGFQEAKEVNWRERAKKDAKARLARRISQMCTQRIGSSFNKPNECDECTPSSHSQQTCWKLVDGRLGRRTRAQRKRTIRRRLQRLRHPHADVEVAFVAGGFTGSTWIADSGASTHIGNVDDGMMDVEDINDPVKDGNGIKFDS